MTEKRRSNQESSWRLGNVECEEHTYQTSIEEAESETVWPFQSIRDEGRQCIEVRNIAEVVNSSCVSRFAVRTLPSL